jgi:hypothetical protein
VSLHARKTHHNHCIALRWVRSGVFGLFCARKDGRGCGSACASVLRVYVCEKLHASRRAAVEYPPCSRLWMKAAPADPTDVVPRWSLWLDQVPSLADDGPLRAIPEGLVALAYLSVGAIRAAIDGKG